VAVSSLRSNVPDGSCCNNTMLGLSAWLCVLCLVLSAVPTTGFLNSGVATLRLRGAHGLSARNAACAIKRAFVPRMSANAEDFDEASMDAFRSLMEESWDGPTFDDEDKEFDGYQFRDLIVEKWGVPYDVQIKREVFLGKPMIFLNVMWKFLGQQSFHLDEQEYLEHLQAIAELCVKWEKVDHLKEVVAECKKRPNAYFGYAVPIPLNLPADVMDELNIPEAQ